MAGEFGEIVIFAAAAFCLFALAIIWRRYRENVRKRFHQAKHAFRK